MPRRNEESMDGIAAIVEKQEPNMIQIISDKIVQAKQRRISVRHAAVSIYSMVICHERQYCNCDRGEKLEQ